MKTTIEYVGQPYLDEPIYARPKRNILVESVKIAYGLPPARQLLLGYQRVKLNWKRPHAPVW